MKKNKVFPLNLQLFADGVTPDIIDGAEPGREPEQASYEELVAQLATERANSAKLKNLNDKFSKELAEQKRQLKARMTAEEQEAAAKKEQDEALHKEVNDLRSKLARISATKRYMQLGMDEALAEETAKAEIEGDMEQVTLNFKKHSENLTKAAYQKFLKERPEINAGNGDTKNSFANERARLAAKRFGSTADSNILAHYGIGGKR